MMNCINLVGRLTRDPELRRTSGGTPVASFTLAVDRDYASKEGGERETDFIDCVVWRNTAEFVSKYMTKGRMVAVSGRLEVRNWTDKEGNKRRSYEVQAENVYFVDSKRNDDNASRPPVPAEPSAEPVQNGGNPYGSYGEGYGSQPPVPAEPPAAPAQSGGNPYGGGYGGNGGYNAYNGY